MPDDPVDDLAGVYRRFAENEERGRSPLYEELARVVAEDRAVQGVLAELPLAKQQPNLLFASVRCRCGVAAGRDQFRGWILDRREDIITTILALIVPVRLSPD